MRLQQERNAGSGEGNFLLGWGLLQHVFDVNGNDWQRAEQGSRIQDRRQSG